MYAWNPPTNINLSAIDDIDKQKLLSDLISIVRFLSGHKCITPSKRLNFIGGISDLFEEFGLKLPEGLTLGRFIELSEGYVPRKIDSRIKTTQHPPIVPQTIQLIEEKDVTSASVIVALDNGLHVEPCREITESVKSNYSSYGLEISIYKGKSKADTRNLLELIGLACDIGNRLEIVVKGSVKEERGKR